MHAAPPPPVISSARVAWYASVEGLPRSAEERIRLAAGRLPDAVTGLAIGLDLAGGGVVLLHCDADWNRLAATAALSVDAAKAAGEAAYPGIGGRWQAAAATDADVEAFLDDEDEGLICSFCGRHPHEVARIVTGRNGAAICELCIRSLRQQVTRERPAEE